MIGEIHARNIAATASAELISVCDSDADRARAVAAKLPSAEWTADIDAVLADTRVQAVVVSTHANARAEIAVAAATAGKHLFLEKPMAMDVAECTRILDAASRSDIIVGVDFKFRFAEAVRRAKARVAQPSLILAQCTLDPMPADSPHMRPEMGGGLLANLGSHIFDLRATSRGRDR